MDVDGKGKVTQSNLKRVLNHELNMGVSDDLIRDMIEATGMHKDDAVSEQDFIKLMKKINKM
jgi:Ca2+-binding EF-hand superfamily protein